MRLTKLLAAMAVIVLPVLPAAAQDSAWQGQATAYVWGAGLGGDVTPFTGAPPSRSTSPLSDVLDNLDGAFFLSGYARREPLRVDG